MQRPKLDSINDKLHKLVWGSSQPEAALVSMGKFPDNWGDDYLFLLSTAESTLRNSSFWPRTLFVSIHFASCYLPLRYEAWKTQAGIDNRETKQILAEISLRSELLIWRTFIEDEAFILSDRISEPQKTFFELTLGSRCPAGIASEYPELQDWYHDFKLSLKAVRQEQVDQEHWPVWILIAVHFISFYVDLLNQRVGLDIPDLKQMPEVELVQKQLAGLPVTPEVVSLIRLWLHTIEVPRDQNGLPAIGTLRQRESVSVSPRILCEVFLQTGNL